ncbi:hypothetical protein TSMEX_006204 [Taenia solium]|eukprot:TsM_001135000 transcript=TsM_001135000 gene=TsM_001135000
METTPSIQFRQKRKTDYLTLQCRFPTALDKCTQKRLYDELSQIKQKMEWQPQDNEGGKSIGTTAAIGAPYMMRCIIDASAATATSFATLHPNVSNDELVSAVPVLSSFSVVKSPCSHLIAAI